ncbi:alpha/beta hydrolase [Rathayibacter sp. YIM 133350]|uniref:alpha/beta fold hydrolase n=1 Tax=Rathayibacter sp. YIM 133350 TaxID=3131992 RepID=UPI00307E05A0
MSDETPVTSDSTRPTIVLVHGAWADGSSWNAVASLLLQQGFTVLVPPNPLRGVSADAGYIASYLSQRTSGPVVLVGHSYGGAVITNAGAEGGDVRALVYVDAFIPDEGDSVVNLLTGTSSALAVEDPTTVLDLQAYPGAPDNAPEAFLKPQVVHEAFAQDLPEGDRDLILASQRPISLVANLEPTAKTAWKSIPSWAVLGTDDRTIPIDLQRRMAERAGATVTEVDASHVSMVSHPDVAVDAILAAVASL